MKTVFNKLARVLMTAVAVLLLGVPAVNAKGYEELDERDRKTVDAAIHLIDNGMVDEGVELFINLDKKHPENGYIIYEIVYAYIVKQDYDSACKWAKKMVKLKNLTDEIYFMAGNAYDYAGKRKEAVKLYEDGLKEFPNSGRLWVEKGNIAYADEDYTEAVRCYEESVEREPKYSPSYYRLARLFAFTDDPVWAIMYAQEYMLVSEKYERSLEMGALIYELYRKNLAREDGKWTARFTKNVSMPPYASLDCDVPYNYLFNSIHTDLLNNDSTQVADTLSLSDVACLHRRFVEMADTIVRDYYDVPVLDMERAALKAGHLDGYIMWMLAGADVKLGGHNFINEECALKADEFVDWYNKEYCKTGAQRGVSRNHTTVTSVVPVPRMSDLGDVKACREHRDEIRAVAQWMIKAVPDTVSVLQAKMSQAMLMWVMNTDELTIELGNSPLQLNKYTFPIFNAAAIDYALGHKKKELNRDDYVSVMTTVAAYARKYRNVLDLDEAVIKIIDLDYQELRKVFENEYDLRKKD